MAQIPAPSGCRDCLEGTHIFCTTVHSTVNNYFNQLSLFVKPAVLAQHLITCFVEGKATPRLAVRTMAHTMPYIGVFFPLYHPVIFTLQRSMQLPQTRSVELQVESHGSFGVHADLLVFSVRWALAVFLR